MYPTLEVTNLTWQKLLGLILRCFIAKSVIGGYRAIFDQSLMSVTSHIISAMNHMVSANEMLFFSVLYQMYRHSCFLLKI